jgi:preprotein translocase subunit SecG
MVVILTIIHILVALFLVLIVLMQSGKGGDVAAAFGGMGSQTAFGPRGTTNFLTKATAILAGVFMVTSLTLAVVSNRSTGGGSVLSGEKAVPAPAQKAPANIPGLPPGAVQLPPGAVQPKITVVPSTAKPAGQATPNGAATPAPSAAPAGTTTAPKP